MQWVVSVGARGVCREAGALRSGALAILLIAGLVAPASWADERSPTQVVEEFYRWRISPDAQESANDADMRYASGRGLFGKELMGALEAQAAYEHSCARVVPTDMKPHMIDQDPFFLEADGAKSLSSLTTRVAGDIARVSAHLAYDDYRWTDQVLLTRQGARWVILDIEWEGGGKLTGRLVAFAGVPCPDPENPSL